MYLCTIYMHARFNVTAAGSVVEGWGDHRPQHCKQSREHIAGGCVGLLAVQVFTWKWPLPVSLSVSCSIR